MNKILFIISDLELGGTQRVLINIANHFSKTNRVVILTLYDRKITNTRISSSIKIKSLKSLQYKIDSNQIIGLKNNSLSYVFTIQF